MTSPGRLLAGTLYVWLAVVPASAETAATTGSSPLVHARNNADLVGMPVGLARVRRDGFASPGDGGAADYTLSATACAAADGGAQVTLASGGCANLDVAAKLTPKLFGGNFTALLKASLALNRPVVIPCGTYNHLPKLAVVVPARQSLVMRGEGRECSILSFSGDGVVAKFEDTMSSIDIEDMTFETYDPRGNFRALAVEQNAINPNPASSPTSQIARVTFRGATATPPFPFWGEGFVDIGVSNINIDNMTFNGNGAGGGNGLSILGYKPDATRRANDGYAVSINVTNYIAFGCDAGIYRGDMVQGLTVTNGQATGCHYGIMVPGETIGENDQIHVRGGQWADDRSGVACLDHNTSHMIVEGGYYISVGSAVAIRSCGETPIISNNTVGGNGSSGSVGISIGSPSRGNNALVTANSIRGVGVGIREEPDVRGVVAIVNNQISDTKKDYQIVALDGETTVSDLKPRKLSELKEVLPCVRSIKGSISIVSNGFSPAFMSAARDGGTRTVRVLCDSDGAGWVAF